MILNNIDPTILEFDMNYVLVGHEKHALCDSYIVQFVHDATGNYYERGKYGCRNFHVTKIPLFLLNVLKLLLLYLPMVASLCFFNLFIYKTPMHRKWVGLKCVSYLLLDTLFASIHISYVSIFSNYWAYLKGVKEKRLWETTHLYFSVFTPFYFVFFVFFESWCCLLL